jgi:quercetin dioxygenase-like cupin family protein
LVNLDDDPSADEGRQGRSVLTGLGLHFTHESAMRILTIILLAMLFATALVVAQSVQEPSIKTAQENTFITSPVLPDCYTYAVERGDPKTGPSVTLSKLAAGCKVPWHVHSANAQVLFVSGTFELTMKGQRAQILSQGSLRLYSSKAPAPGKLPRRLHVLRDPGGRR